MSQEHPSNEPSELSAGTRHALAAESGLGSVTELPAYPTVHSDEEEATDQALAYPLVAVGASKGGLEAYVDLFRTVPADTGMTFVVLPHLSPEHASELANILQGVTSMAVREMSADLRPEPNTVYVLPANTRAALEAGVFKLEPRP